MKAKNIFIGSMLFMSTLWLANAHNHGYMDAETTMVEAGTIVDIAVDNPDFSTLVTAVVEAGLVDTLSSEGPFTVFAPTNEAFAALPEGTLEMLLMSENIGMLQDILTYHVLPGDVRAGALQRWLGTSTVEWSEVRFEMVDGKWYINGAEIISTDIVAENGVIHVIDNVILPPVGMMEMEMQKEMIEVMLNEEEMILIENFDIALNNLLSGRHTNIQNRLINRVLSTIDISLATRDLTESQVNMLSYLRLHIMMM